MNVHDKEALLEFYKNHLKNVLLPFWNRALDEDQGGVFTCFNNNGDILISHDKYTWSQGRLIWIWSKIADLCNNEMLDFDPNPYLRHAKLTADFLLEHAFLPNGNCAFLLSKDGHYKESISGAGYDTSFYADCFVVLGLSCFSRINKSLKYLERALILYDSIIDRVKKGNLRSEPYPIAEGYRAHSVPMILLNIASDLFESLQAFKHPKQNEFRKYCEVIVNEILTLYRKEDGLIAEMIPEDVRQFGSLLARHINPGHTIEDMWFIIHAAKLFNYPEWINPAVESIAVSLNIGWDSEFGGLLRFVDKNGGKPTGMLISDPYEQLILDTWDTKLWWPHSEALYATLLAERITHDERWGVWYKKIHNYVFNTFPNPDISVKEWIQIRDRKGIPIEKVVALPVKDPFHIIRNVLLIIELLEDNSKFTFEGVNNL
jgi:N-acylglucosamine 2-epimerase